MIVAKQPFLNLTLKEDDNGYSKIIHCYPNHIQVIEEMSFEDGTIVISKSGKRINIEITDLQTLDTIIIENKDCLFKSALHIAKENSS